MTNPERKTLSAIVATTTIAGSMIGFFAAIFLMGQTRGSDINRLENVEQVVPIVRSMEIRMATVESKFDDIQRSLNRIERKETR